MNTAAVGLSAAELSPAYPTSMNWYPAVICVGGAAVVSFGDKACIATDRMKGITGRKAGRGAIFFLKGLRA